MSQRLCACGCGKEGKTKSPFNQGHLSSWKSNFGKGWEEELKKIKSRNVRFCKCGCGKKVNFDWAPGHHYWGERGYSDHVANQYKNKKGPSGFVVKRVKRMPSDGEIVQAHLPFLGKAKIDPELCWCCQKTPTTCKAHIRAVGDGGDNDPDDLILLCESCHMLQHFWGYRPDWNREKQYRWLKLMRQWDW